MKSKYYVYDEKQFDKEYDVVTMERKLEETKRNRLELIDKIDDEIELYSDMTFVLFKKAGNERTKKLILNLINEGLDGICGKMFMLEDPTNEFERAKLAGWNARLQDIAEILNGEDKDEDDR